MKIYRADANGNATGRPVATSGHGATDGEVGYEEATILDPAGTYVVRVQNYAGIDPWRARSPTRDPTRTAHRSRRPTR